MGLQTLPFKGRLLAMTREENRRIAEAWNRSMDGTAKVICRAAGLSLDDVAKRVGVQETTVWRWLEGQSLARGNAGLRFADLLSELLPTALGNLDQEERAAEDMVERAEGYRRAVAELRVLAPHTDAVQRVA